jgi:hypothetical protein
VVLIFGRIKIKPQIIFITSNMPKRDYDATDYLQKPIALDRFNASVIVDLHLLKQDTKEDGEHIFIK